MITFGEVRKWKSDQLHEVERTLATCVAQIKEIKGGLLATKLFDTWKSQAADGAAGEERKLVTELDRLGEAIKQARTGVMLASDAIDDLRPKVIEAVTLAGHHGLEIKDDGEVTRKNKGLLAYMDPDLLKGDKRDEVEDRVRAIMKTAEEIDEDCAMMFARASATTHGNELQPTLLSGFSVPRDTREQSRPGTVLNRIYGGDAEDGRGFSLSETDVLLGDPSAAIKAWGIKNRASNEAVERYGQEGAEDGRTDAFRHAYGNALMARHLGDAYATNLGTAHEQGNNYDGAESMDLYNNEIGREIAKANPGATDEELAQKISEALERGDLIIISDSGELTRSDGTTRDPGLPGVERPEEVRPESYQKAWGDHAAVNAIKHGVIDGVRNLGPYLPD